MSSRELPRRHRRVVAGGAVAAVLLAVAALLGWRGRPADDGPAGPGDAAGSALSATTPGSDRAGTGEGDDDADLALSGFAHDETGAVQAAVAYTAASRHGWLHLGDDVLAEAVAQIAVPQAADALAAQVVEETRPTREQLSGSESSASWVDPLAWRVETYSDVQARVAVWIMTTLAAPGLSVPQSEWMTVTVDLEWVEGDWRVAALANRAGPTPMTSPGDDPWGTARFVAELELFSRLGPVPGATPSTLSRLSVATWDGAVTAADGGFAHDEWGAVDAALAYTAASQRWLYLSEREVAEAVAKIAAPRAVDTLVAEVVEETGIAREELAESDGPVWWWVDPLAWRVETFSDAQARVAVWTTTVLSAQGVAVPQSGWMTVTVDLERVEGDWRVAAIGDRPGPTPILSRRDEPWDAVPFAEALEGFTRLGEEPAT